MKPRGRGAAYAVDDRVTIEATPKSGVGGSVRFTAAITARTQTGAFVLVTDALSVRANNPEWRGIPDRMLLSHVNVRIQPSGGWRFEVVEDRRGDLVVAMQRHAWGDVSTEKLEAIFAILQGEAP